MSKSPITCHVLDSSVGRPAAGMRVELSTIVDGEVDVLAEGTTDADGRLSNLLDPGTRLVAGAYKMTFHTAPYFSARDVATFYPFVEITFLLMEPDQHYHIPLLLSPFSYTTYRGS